MRRTGVLFFLLLIIAPSRPSFGEDWVGDITRDLREERAAIAPMGLGAAGPVAVVGAARVDAAEAFELWTPVWRETQGRVRNGKLTPAEGDARLQAEWQRVILALIKDELFFQEAEREHASVVNAIADRMLRNSNSQGQSRSRVVAEIRKIMEQDMQRFFRQLNAEVVKDSGGMVKLHKVLEGRGLSVTEWQNRLQRKAFTQSYLHQILKPRAPDPGPRQIQKYYADHPDEFAEPGIVRFRHIFLSNAKRGPDAARDAAVAVWERLIDGEIPFEDAARQYSDDPESAGRGGLEAEAEASDPEREAWLADIRAALREETPGEIGDILESPFGYHVAALVSVGQPRKIPFAEVRREIERKLMGEIWEEEADKYFASIRQRTDIRVLAPAFPPNLSCAAMSAMTAEQPGAAGGRTPRVYSTTMPGVR